MPQSGRKMLSNAFGNINYQRANFRPASVTGLQQCNAGIWYPLQRRALPTAFARYQDKLLDITIGNIYEQFGSGLFVSYLLRARPVFTITRSMVSGLFPTLQRHYRKGLVGRQRSFFTLDPALCGVWWRGGCKDLLDSVFPNLKNQNIGGRKFC